MRLPRRLRLAAAASGESLRPHIALVHALGDVCGASDWFFHIFIFLFAPLPPARQVHSGSQAQRHVRTWLCVGCCAAPATVRR